MSSNIVQSLVVPCNDLAETLDFFTEKNEFRLHRIYPAEDPSIADIENHGRYIRLVKQESGPYPDYPAIIGGSTQDLSIETVDLNPHMKVPSAQDTFEMAHLGDDSDWVIGRVGMEYRNLISEENGRFGASNIRITKGGPVEDYVHFHQIRFQMIYCYKGWAKVVYENQGESIIMKSGDCVLQPPGIRHRVLESSTGLEVIEINSPAKHMTGRDHSINLPSQTVDSDRLFIGQKFLHHQASSGNGGELGILEATNGMMSASIIHPKNQFSQNLEGKFIFNFVLQGDCELVFDKNYSFSAGGAFIFPTGKELLLNHCSSDLKILQVVELP